jgi:hypothetical protein
MAAAAAARVSSGVPSSVVQVMRPDATKKTASPGWVCRAMLPPGAKVRRISSRT